MKRNLRLTAIRSFFALCPSKHGGQHSEFAVPQAGSGSGRSQGRPHRGWPLPSGGLLERDRRRLWCPAAHCPHSVRRMRRIGEQPRPHLLEMVQQRLSGLMNTGCFTGSSVSDTVFGCTHPSQARCNSATRPHRLSYSRPLPNSFSVQVPTSRRQRLLAPSFCCSSSLTGQNSRTSAPCFAAHASSGRCRGASVGSESHGVARAIFGFSKCLEQYDLGVTKKPLFLCFHRIETKL